MANTDIGNGQGYLYQTLRDGVTIQAVKENNPDGADLFRRIALTNAPLAQPRSAVGGITITGCASAGNVTAVTINGVNQLGAPIPCATAVPATLAALIAAGIAAFAPATGPDYTAYSIGANISVVSPPAVGLSVNTFVITVTVDDVSITSTTSPMAGGSSSAGSTDPVTGFEYFVDANYNGTPADPASLVNAVNITKDITKRGLEGGIPKQAKVISGDAIATADRYSSVILYTVDTEGGAASDKLVWINPNGFIEGDVIILRGTNPAHAVVVESAPVTGSPAPFKNMYLAGDLPLTINSAALGMTMVFIYDAILGPVFVEFNRSGGNVLNGKTNYMTFFDTDTTVTENPSAFYDPATKRLAISQSDTQATPALLANIDSPLNFVIEDSPGSQANIISVLMNGLDDADAFKLKLFSTDVTTGSIAMYELISRSLLIWPGVDLALGISLFSDGDFITGTREGVSPWIAGAGNTLYWGKGIAVCGTGKGVRIYDLSTVGFLPANHIEDTAPFSLYHPISNGGSAGTNTWEWKVFSRANNGSGVGSPIYVILLRKFADATPNTDISTIDALKISESGVTSLIGLAVAAGTRKGQITQIAGTKTVNTTEILSNTEVFLTRVGGTAGNFGHLYVANVVVGVSFDIVSTNVADVSVVNWLLI